jgi:pilus assembly protein Flp/PilA
MKREIGWFIKNEDGQGMVEYSLVLALVALVAIGAVALLGDTTNQLFENAMARMPF